MPRVGFEPTISVFEGAKTVHASDFAVTVIVKSISPNGNQILAVQGVARRYID
jgi:hypothetical protein